MTFLYVHTILVFILQLYDNALEKNTAEDVTFIQILMHQIFVTYVTQITHFMKYLNCFLITLVLYP